MISREQVCELFCGAGGMGAGFGQYFDITYAADLSRSAVQTYQANHLDTDVREQDVRNLSGCKGDFYGITGVIGGPPCQGSSIINTKRCADDPRNALMSEFMRLVTEIRPEFFVMENVPGVPKEKKAEVVSLGKSARYDVQSLYLNAADYGAAQTRKRWVVVGTRHKAWQKPSPRKARTVRDAFSGLRENWGVMNSSEKTLSRLRTSQVGEWTAMSGKFKNMIRLSWGSPAPAVVNLKKVYMVHPAENRNISLAEAAALQGFPPGYQWEGTESQIAQMIANAMPAELAGAIAGSFAPGGYQASLKIEGGM